MDKLLWNCQICANFDIGKGYQMATDSGATQILAFTGTISSSDETVDTRRWNLVANPYPSFINANDDADNTNNFLTTNVNKIDSNFLAIYGWDADGSGYTARGHDYNSNAAVYFASFMIALTTLLENITHKLCIFTKLMMILFLVM